MTDPRTVWDSALPLMPLIGQQQSPPMFAAIEAAGVPPKLIGMLFHAWDFAPRPLTPAGVAECSPYYADAVYESRMTDLAALGFLTPTGAPHTYALTDKGLAAADAISRAGFEPLAESHPIPADDLARMTGYFGRVVEAARRNPQTPDCPCLADQTHPEAPHEASYLGWLAEYLGDLYRYKCDCHTTAWRKRPVSAFAMEPFTHIWRENVSTLAGLVARTEQERMNRGHSEADYSRFADELAGNGWLTRDGDSFALTGTGRAVRDTIEAETDAAFFGVWNTLTPAELDDLAGLIANLKAALEAL